MYRGAFAPLRGKKALKIILVTVLLLFVIVSRFAWLADKPYHHDESQYASFSYYNFKGSLYEYNPILHGPFLFYFNMLVYAVLGDGDFTARLGPAFLGSMLTLVLLLMSRWLGFKASFILASAYAVSPSFTYFNRFLSHDTYMAFFSVLTIFFFIEHLKFRKPVSIYLCSAAWGFLLLIKISSYIYTFMFISFALILLFANLKGEIYRQRSSYINDLKKQSIHLIFGLLTAFAVFFLFYSSFFMHMRGFFDGLFVKSLGYWIEQNAEQRIKGDFDYYLPIIATYELPIVLTALVSICKKLFEAKMRMIITSMAILTGIILMMITANFWESPVFGFKTTLAAFFDQHLHMHAPYHLFLALLFLYAGIFLTWDFIKEGKFFTAFAHYWLFFSLLIYGYAGEKVPWLSLNITMPLCFVASLALARFFKSSSYMNNPILRLATIVALAISLTWTVFINYRVSIRNPADPKERLVFVQTSTDIQKILNKFGDGVNLKIAVHGEAAWPLNWYLRHFKSIFPPPPIEDPDNQVIVINYGDIDKYSYLKADYKFERFKLREWWVPDMSKKIGPKELLRYYIYRETWSPTGSQDISLLTK